MADLNFEAVSVKAVGTTVSLTTSSSVATAMPVTANGENPRFVRVQFSTLGYIKFGQADVACTTNDIMVNSNIDRVFDVRGTPYFAAMTDTGTGKVNVTPVER